MCDNVDTTLDKHLHKVDTIYESDIVRVTIYSHVFLKRNQR